MEKCKAKCTSTTEPFHLFCFHLTWLGIERQYNHSKHISNVFDSSSVALSICNVNIVKMERLIFFIYNRFHFCIIEGKVLQFLFAGIFIFVKNVYRWL